MSTPATTRALPARLLAFIVLPVVVVLVIGAFVALRSLERSFEQRMQDEVEMVGRALQPVLSLALERGENEHVARALESALRIGRVYGAYVYDRDGNLFASSGTSHSTLGEVERVPEVLERGRRTGGYGKVGGESVYSYYVPLNGRGQILGLLEVTRRKRDFEQFMEALRTRAAVTLGIAIAAVTAIVLVGYYGAVGRAVRSLRSSMVRVESGERDHRADPDGPREIAGVARSLNEMLDAIAAAETTVRDQREERDALERKLRHSEKLAALGRLAAGVAHELGTPLSVVRGRAQRALRSPGLEDEAKKLATITHEEARRMEAIVRQLLDFARLEDRERVSVAAGDLASMAAGAVETETSGRDVALTVDPGEDDQVVRVNLARAEQALINLLKNACQAATSRVRLGCERRGDTVVYVVEDDGPGLPTDDWNALFEPFFTTKSPGEGTGLGLSIAHAVAEEHGTGIAAGASPELGGARFALELPRASPATPPRRERDG